MKKKEEFEGYVFLCSDSTEEECLERSLFGGGEKYANRVKGIEKGKKLFLYNYQSKKLHGVFEAATNLKENIVPKAWGGEYPMQIKVKKLTTPKPLSREELGKDIFGFDMTGKPTSRLTKEKVEALEKLFKNSKRKQTFRDDIQYITNDGHRVRSKAEQQIDNWLYEHKISHGYEVSIGHKNCDFEIQTVRGNIYIEYWGLEEPNYLKNKEVKEKLYRAKKLELISLYPDDLKNLNIRLKKLL